MNQGLRWNTDAGNETDRKTIACKGFRTEARIALKKKREGEKR